MSDAPSDLASLRLAAIVKSSDDAIVEKNLQGVITSWNRAAERMFGFTADEAVGRSIAMIIPNDRLDEEHGLIARIRNGESVELFETIRRRKDGILFPVSLTVSPIFGADGTIIGASKIARDISDRKHAEVAIATAEALQSDLQRRLFALVAASSKLLGSPRLDDVLPAILALARELIAADGYAIWRFDQQSGVWRVGSSWGISEDFSRRIVASLSSMRSLVSPSTAWCRD